MSDMTLLLVIIILLILEIATKKDADVAPRQKIAGAI